MIEKKYIIALQTQRNSVATNKSLFICYQEDQNRLNTQNGNNNNQPKIYQILSDNVSDNELQSELTKLKKEYPDITLKCAANLNASHKENITDIWNKLTSSDSLELETEETEEEEEERKTQPDVPPGNIKISKNTSQRTANDDACWIVEPTSESKDNQKNIFTFKEGNQRISQHLPQNKPAVIYKGFNEQQLKYLLEQTTFAKHPTGLSTIEIQNPAVSEGELTLPPTTAQTILINDTNEQGTLEHLTVSKRIQPQNEQNDSDNQETYVHIANAPKLKKLSVPKDAVVKFDQKVTKKTLDLSGVTKPITLEFYGEFDFKKIIPPKDPSVKISINCPKNQRQQLEDLIKTLGQNSGTITIPDTPLKKDTQEPTKKVKKTRKKGKSK